MRDKPDPSKRVNQNPQLIPDSRMNGKPNDSENERQSQQDINQFHLLAPLSFLIG